VFEWFADLSPILKFGAAFLFLGIGVVTWFCGYFVPWVWAVGIVLLMAAILIGGNSSGYRF
jgi:hypothetical protein